MESENPKNIEKQDTPIHIELSETPSATGRNATICEKPETPRLKEEIEIEDKIEIEESNLETRISVESELVEEIKKHERDLDLQPAQAKPHEPTSRVQIEEEPAHLRTIAEAAAESPSRDSPRPLRTRYFDDLMHSGAFYGANSRLSSIGSNSGSPYSTDYTSSPLGSLARANARSAYEVRDSTKLRVITAIAVLIVLAFTGGIIYIAVIGYSHQYSTEGV